MIPAEKRRIKVMHVITRMDMGGSAQNTLLTCLGLNKRLYDVLLVFGPGTESEMTPLEEEIVTGRLELARKSGVRCLMVDGLLRRIDPLKDMATAFSLWRLCRRERPDIVHTHTSKAGILGRWAAFLAGVPAIVHTPHGHVFFGHFSIGFSRLFYLAEKLTEPVTDMLVALTQGEKKDYLDLGLTRGHKMATVHSGVDTRLFAPVEVDNAEKRASLGLRPDGPVVGSVGWLLPIKGPDLLLEAMARVWKEMPDARLLFIGKGFLEKKLRKRAADLGMSDRVCFAGWRDDIPEILQIMDVFVLPSRNEGMGRAIVEAMAAGKPVIGTDVGGIPDLIVNGRNGFLVPAENALALAEAIIQILMDRNLAAQMGAEGTRQAGRFDLKAMHEQVSRLYETLWSRRLLRAK